jgi:vancomycin permeability regulator SanA
MGRARSETLRSKQVVRHGHASREPTHAMPSASRQFMWFIAVLGATFLSAAVAISAGGLSDRVVMADVVVVPGNTVYPDGTLSDRLKGRLDAAVEIHRAGNCQAVFVSGAVGSEGVDESTAMQSYLVQRGVPAHQIIQDQHGVNTEATARNAAVMMQQRGFTTALAVSQYFHVPRLRVLLQHQGVNVVGTAHANYFEARDAYSLAREVLAMAVLLLSELRR